MAGPAFAKAMAGEGACPAEPEGRRRMGGAACSVKRRFPHANQAGPTLRSRPRRSLGRGSYRVSLPSRRPHLRDRGARQFVGALVQIVPGVAAHPVPVHAGAGSSAASSRCHRSMFFTGFLSAVLQPLRFQPLIQPGDAVAHVLAVGVEVDGARAASAPPAPRSRAISSMRLLVVCGSPPLSSRVVSPHCRIAPQPPGPGIARAGAVGVDR